MKRTMICLNLLATMIFVGAAPCAMAEDDEECSNASLQGTYGFTVGAIVAPGTPRGIVGRINFDGDGNWTNALTMNDNGTIRKIQDHGTYTVNADCTGTLSPETGAGGTIEIVVVDGGNEFYELRTDPATIIFLFNAAKKQRAGGNQ